MSPRPMLSPEATLTLVRQLMRNAGHVATTVHEQIDAAKYHEAADNLGDVIDYAQDAQVMLRNLAAAHAAGAAPNLDLFAAHQERLGGL